MGRPSKTQRTFYCSEAKKERLLKLDPEASFSQLINRAIDFYYEEKVEERWRKKEKLKKFKL